MLRKISKEVVVVFSSIMGGITLINSQFTVSVFLDKCYLGLTEVNWLGSQERTRLL